MKQLSDLKDADIEMMDNDSLDYYVAVTIGCERFLTDDRAETSNIPFDCGVSADGFSDIFSPSTIWNHGMPIIEINKIDFEWQVGVENWKATTTVNPKNGYGDTILQAAMRAFLKSYG
ncbi:MAG TPA: phage protein NinX family protein [Methylotenera sp.]|nr:phage protein NinX family protein [Methylotenera sp.]